MKVQSPRLWAHSLEDYQRMFDLSAQDLGKCLLDYGSGPSSFNAELTTQGQRIVSCDALYALPPKPLAATVNKYIEENIAFIKTHKESFTWHHIANPSSFEASARLAKEHFLADFQEGVLAGRYQSEILPKLPFHDYQFDLALCPHFLFEDPDTTAETALLAILEFCRVAQEVRIFPLVDFKSTSKLIGPLLSLLSKEDLGVEVRQVPFEFQKSGNAMLRVYTTACVVKK